MSKRQERIAALLSERDKFLADAKAVVEANPDGMSDEDLAKVKDLKGKADAHKASVEKLQAEEKLAADLAADDAWGDSAMPRITQPSNPAATPAPKVEIKGGEESAKFSTFGEYLAKVRKASAIQAGAEVGQIDRRLMATATGLGVDVPSDGGFLVPPDFARELLRRAYDNGQILSRCRKVNLTGNTYKMPYLNETSRATGSRGGGVTGYWLDEGAEITSSKPSFGQLELKLKRLAVLGYVTEEMLQDYAATESILLDLFADEVAFMAENAVVRGTGAGQPLGILNANCLVTVSEETSQPADTIWGDNVAKMASRMWARSRPSAVWLINQDCEPQLMSLVAKGTYDASSSTGIPLYMPSGTAWNNTAYATLGGRPVIPVEYCSTVGDVGDIIFADLNEYVLADKGTAQMASSMHVRFIYGEQAFRVTYRVDGQPGWSAALTPFQGTNTVSPFVVVETR